MPQYLFEHPNTGEVIEIVQKMNDAHIYTDLNGVEWKRVFVNPKISFDTNIGVHSEKDFVQKTMNKNYTVGDLWEKSSELSEKRKEKEGFDKVKEKAMSDYEKKTNGKKHPARKQKIETKDFIIET